MPPGVWELLPRAGLCVSLGRSPCRVHAVLEKNSLFMMQCFCGWGFPTLPWPDKGSIRLVTSISPGIMLPLYVVCFMSPSPTAKCFTGSQVLLQIISSSCCCGGRRRLGNLDSYKLAGNSRNFTVSPADCMKCGSKD